MISIGLVAAITVASLIGLIGASGFAGLRAANPYDRIAAGLAVWVQTILLIAVCGLWAGVGAVAVFAAGTVMFAGLAALVGAIKLARHASLATALARPSGAVGKRAP
jgi:hypothetical protein